MTRIVIALKDQDVPKLKELLSQVNYIESVEEKKDKDADPISRLSQESLAEDWSSEEDERYNREFDKT